MKLRWHISKLQINCSCLQHGLGAGRYDFKMGNFLRAFLHYARFLTVGIKAKTFPQPNICKFIVDCPKTFHRTLTQTLTICSSTDFCVGQPFVDFYKDIHLKQLRCILFCFSITSHSNVYLPGATTAFSCQYLTTRISVQQMSCHSTFS